MHSKTIETQDKYDLIIKRLDNLTAYAEKILIHITDSKAEILKSIEDVANPPGRPRGCRPKRRGPKDTQMMKFQRTSLVIYVTVELHKNILDVALADAYHVWHQPENVEAWNKAATRKDRRRGYRDYATLYGVIKALAEKRKLNVAKITAV